jgi:hypothetical protein
MAQLPRAHAIALKNGIFDRDKACEIRIACAADADFGGAGERTFELTFRHGRGA